MRARVVVYLLFACFTMIAAARAAEERGVVPDGAYTPYVAPASDEGESAMAGFKLPPGFKVDLFAAEPRLSNPVSFTIDEHGRFFVVETFRRKKDVIDIRNEMSWLDEDTASRTVAARIEMITRHRTPEVVVDMTRAFERVKLIEDRDGDGHADHDQVFADGFNRLEDGIAAGILVRGSDVFFTDIPSLWRLRDTNGDGVADTRDELQYGYGVRYNFNGHDLHGLRFGPDGKLYFSIGDRGMHVEKTPDGRVVSNPDSGCVLRCNPDGTELEVFHTGLRNPQELAFDEYGNLFTGDNNCDAGDKARWVYVVEGGDSGWRVGYQNQDFPGVRGPWMYEGLWQEKPNFPTFYLLPPVVELNASGPSGLTHDPGTGLPPEFAGRFFLADFRGGPALSSVQALLCKPKGATFEMVEQKPIIGNVLVTDVEFGYDGLYLTDWTNGWVTTGKGRIYHLWHEAAIKDPKVAEAKKIIGEGMAKRPTDEVVNLLAHADQRVRQAAQFELVARGEADRLKAVARDPSNRLARFHAIWGLGQLARKTRGVMEPVVSLLSDRDDEVRTQAAKVLGDVHDFKPAVGPMVKALDDASPRVKFYAALGVGKLGAKEAGPKIVELLRSNADQDPYLRHACVMALSKLRTPEELAGMAGDESSSVRMGALLALRRLQSPLVANFLDDKEPNLVLEAARAINDVPIDPAMPKLAMMLNKQGLSEPVVYRAMNANYRAGTPQGAAALAQFADGPAKDMFRVEALHMLAAWDKVPGRDRVVGNWRPLPAGTARDQKIASDAAGPVMPDILRTAPDEVRTVAAGLVTRLGVKDAPLLAELAGDRKLSPAVRAAALGALAETGDASLAAAVDDAMKDSSERVRAAGVRALAKLPDPVKRLGAILEPADGASSASIPEQQAAIESLASIPGEDADRIIADLLTRMTAGGSESGHVPAGVRLDVLEAAAARKSASVAEPLAKYEKTRDANDPLSAWRESLEGGDVAAGEKIFKERLDVSCMRCHSVNKKGGKAGPDLAGVGVRLDRQHILESIIQPSKVIAAGFETVTVRLKDGTTYVGLVKDEDANTLHLVDPGKSDKRIDKTKIKARRGGASSMPENISATLSKRDVRNLVAYLSSLDKPVKEKKKGGTEAGE
jgi:quinoprotein glucose dehydrogenase